LSKTRTDPGSDLAVPYPEMRGVIFPDLLSLKETLGSETSIVLLFSHGGWWVTDNYTQLSGPVALQFSNGSYMKAMETLIFLCTA
jgi:hypothetical protein